MAVSQATRASTTTCGDLLLATNENCLKRDRVNTSVFPQFFIADGIAPVCSCGAQWPGPGYRPVTGPFVRVVVDESLDYGDDDSGRHCCPTPFHVRMNP